MSERERETDYTVWNKRKRDFNKDMETGRLRWRGRRQKGERGEDSEEEIERKRDESHKGE